LLAQMERWSRSTFNNELQPMARPPVNTLATMNIATMRVMASGPSRRSNGAWRLPLPRIAKRKSI
jgi:hypothetical protein